MQIIPDEALRKISDIRSNILITESLGELQSDISAFSKKSCLDESVLKTQVVSTLLVKFDSYLPGKACGSCHDRLRI